MLRMANVCFHFFLDSGSDIFIVVRYYFETKWYKGGANDAFIKSNNSDKCQLMGKNEEPNVQSTLNCDNAIERFSQGKNISIHCIQCSRLNPTRREIRICARNTFGSCNIGLGTTVYSFRPISN